MQELILPENTQTGHEESLLRETVINNTPFLVVWLTFMLFMVFCWWQWGWYIWQVGFILLVCVAMLSVACSLALPAYLVIQLADRAFPVVQNYYLLIYPAPAPTPARQLASKSSLKPLPKRMVEKSHDQIVSR